MRPGGATKDLTWDCPKGFRLETVVPDGEGGLYLVASTRTLHLRKGTREPVAFCSLGSSAGAACRAANGALVLGHGDRVHRVNTRGKAHLLATDFGDVFGVAVDRQGRLYVSDWKRGEVVRVEGKKRTVVAKGLEYPSGLALDVKERLYIKESGRMTNRDMTVRRLDADGEVRLFATVPSISRWKQALPKKAPAPPTRTDDGAGRLVDLSFKEAPVAKVIAEIARLSGQDVLIVPGAGKDKITVRLHDVPWKKALEMVAKDQGLVVHYEAHNIIRVVKEAPEPVGSVKIADTKAPSLEENVEALRKDVAALRGEVRELTSLVRRLLSGRAAGVHRGR